MKIRILDRLLVALAGLVLLALCAGVVAQVFCNVPVTDYIDQWLATPDQTVTIVTIAVAAALLIVGIYCVCMMFRHRKGKRGFVLQKTENGELSIAIKAMEHLVQQCVESHPEMKLNSIRIDPEKDGVTVHVRITLASGVSIPLAVGALQKQVRTYLTSCSGVDVREVRVQVDTSADQAKDSPYAVQGIIAPASAPLLHGGEAVKQEATVKEEPAVTVDDAPVAVPVEEPAAAEEAPAEPETVSAEEVAEEEKPQTEEAAEETAEEAAESEDVADAQEGEHEVTE
jgi:NADH:ubiquinone oxidoreductase subunit K